MLPHVILNGILSLDRVPTRLTERRDPRANGSPRKALYLHFIITLGRGKKRRKKEFNGMRSNERGKNFKSGLALTFNEFCSTKNIFNLHNRLVFKCKALKLY